MFKKISIIIPAYNVSEYIYQSLESILDMKNPKEKEVIIVDDGSTDNTLEIIREFISNAPFEIKLISQKNGGQSCARNCGLKIAQGEYVFFMDSDDLVHCDVLDEMHSKAVDTVSDIVVANYYEFTDIRENKKLRLDKSNFFIPLVSLDERLQKLFTIDISFSMCNKLYKRSFLEKEQLTFKEGFWFEDLDFIFKAFYEANRIEKVEGYIYGYRQRPNSIMKSLSPKVLDKLTVMDGLACFLREKKTFKRYNDLYDILFLKMAFSILASLVKGDTNSFREIANGVFSNPHFDSLIKSNYLHLQELKRVEKLFYYLIKFKMVNIFTLKSLSLIIKSWK